MNRIRGAMSKRAAFRLLQPEAKVLDHLDKIGLGRPTDLKTRKMVAVKRRQYGVSKNRVAAVDNRLPVIEVEQSPYPFSYGPKAVFKVEKVDSFDALPHYEEAPEVAVVGRSNVGKSTLLNALLGFKSHVQEAKVSTKPGETTQLQFFCIGNPNKKSNSKTPKLVVVDMPGYGFSFMSEAVAEQAYKLCAEYICARGSSLKRILLLLDARHGFKKADTDYFNELIAAVTEAKGPKPSWKLQVVLTKCDLLARKDLARQITLVREHMSEKLHGFALSNLPIVTVSGYQRRGIVQLQREIASLVPKPTVVPAPEPTDTAVESNHKYQISKAPIENKSSADTATPSTKPKNKSKLSEIEKSENAGECRNNGVQSPQRSRPADTKSEKQIKSMTSLVKQDKQLSVISEISVAANPKIAPMLRPKKSIISKPEIDDRVTAMAPIVNDETVSLSMSDRLAAILEHHFAKLHQESSPETERDTLPSPSSEHPSDRSLSNIFESSDLVDGSIQPKDQGRKEYVKDVTKIKWTSADMSMLKEAITPIPPLKPSLSKQYIAEINKISPNKRFKKARTQEELESLRLKKEAYKNRYGRTKDKSNSLEAEE